MLNVSPSTSVALFSKSPVPPSATVNVISSVTVLVSLPSTGVSFTGVTLKVIVFGLWSVFWFAPPVAPLSTTWKVKLESALPLPLRGGVHVSKPMLAAGTTCPAVTATPFKNKTPDGGNVVTITLCKVLAGVSLGSVKPKSATVNV